MRRLPLALVLAAVGVYGIVAYSLSGRTREIGIRMALGAAGRGEGRAVMGPALAPSVAGIGLGSVGAVLLGRALAPDRYEVKPHDPLTFALVALILLGAVRRSPAPFPLVAPAGATRSSH